MTVANGPCLYTPGDNRRALAPAEHREEAAQAPAMLPYLPQTPIDDSVPRWALPLYQQPDRPSQAAITAYQRGMAAERALSVPHGMNLVQQADEAAQQALPDMIHCVNCEAPYEAYECGCPYCHYEE